jgi:hypothetical protein
MLNLCDLEQGLPAITPSFGQYLAQAGAVCLESQGHQQGKALLVQGDHIKQYSLKWPVVTDQMLRCLNDAEVATEHGAVGIAVVLVEKIVGFSVMERSRKGTGFDYWLGDDEDVPFQNKARLEISGIRKGDEAAIRNRVSEKMRQTDRSDESGLPAYIVVVEFSRPVTEVRRK